VQVKVCGLTRPEDVRCVAECEVEFAGFILYEKSKRYIAPSRIRELVRLLPASTTKVGVVVNVSAEFAREACEVGGLDLIQFCGDEAPEVVSALPRAWRAVGLADEEAVRLAVGLPGEAVLVDSISDGAHGGTGRRCNWRLAGLLAAQRPVVLAGGLHPDNVAEAIRQVRPFAVDVASGVETAPGIKDHAKIRAFVRNARNA
jgi:phosphoribosylanthranilate isomerase